MYRSAGSHTSGTQSAIPMMQRRAIVVADREGVVRFWSAGAEFTFGYPAAEAIAWKERQESHRRLGSAARASPTVSGSLGQSNVTTIREFADVIVC